MFDPLAGAYTPLDTPLHRADPKGKFAAFLILVLLASLCGFPGRITVLLLIFLSAHIARIPLRDLFRPLKPLLPFLLLILLMNSLFSQDGQVIVSAWIFCVTREGIRLGLLITLAMTELVLLSTILRKTTTPLELTGAIISIMRPLRKLGVNTEDFGLVLMAAIQFIPVLQEESQLIIRAQKARGAQINTGSLSRRFRSIIPLVIPILVSAFRRGDELSRALIARGYRENSKSGN